MDNFDEIYFFSFSSKKTLLMSFLEGVAGITNGEVLLTLVL